jgi:hypothetical protein
MSLKLDFASKFKVNKLELNQLFRLAKEPLKSFYTVLFITTAND